MIKYRAGYEYQLVEDYTVHLPELIAEQTLNGWLQLWDGFLSIKAGYAWDGPSGPAIDTANFMRGSLVHDALYQLLRRGKLAAHHRETADKILRRLCVEDGMTKLRAWWVYQGVRFGGGPSAHPDGEPEILTAP